MMIVRTASVDELPQIEAMYAAIVDAMQNTPLDVWWQMGSHPSHEMLLDAVSDGNLLVAVDEESDKRDVADVGDGAAETANPVLGRLYSQRGFRVWIMESSIGMCCALMQRSTCCICWGFRPPHEAAAWDVRSSTGPPRWRRNVA